MKHLLKSTLSIVGLSLFLISSASAQIKGTTAQVKLLRSETTASIMLRGKTTKPSIPYLNQLELEVDRSNLRQNPASNETPFGNNDLPRPGILGGGKVDSILPYFSLQSSFLGSDSTLSIYAPPDTIGDVSPTQVLIPVNGRIRLFDRAGSLVLTPALTPVLNETLEVFFGLPSVGDPRCKFDRLSQRWYVLAFDTASPANNILLAVSDSNSISASTVWTYYKIPSIGTAPTGGYFWDYPTMGVDANGIYVGGNIFTTAGSFKQVDMMVINKAELSGTSTTATYFRDIAAGGVGMYTPQPCDNDDPAATVAYVIGVDIAFYGKLDMRKFTYSAGAFTMSANIPINVSTTAGPAPVSVPGGTISAVDERLFGAKMYLDTTTGQRSIWTAHNIPVNSSGVATSGGRVGVRWYQFTNLTAAAPTLANFGTVFDPSGTPKSFVMPTVAQNLQGHSLTAFTQANSTTVPGIGSSFRLNGGTFSPFGVDFNGTVGSTYNYLGGRWGDYSHTVIDPRDGMSIWSFQEYVSATNRYAIRVLKYRAPAPTISTVNIGSILQGGMLTANIAGTGLFDPGAGYPDRLSASVSGTGVTVNSITYVSPTQVSISLSATAAAATGSRTITVTNPDGQTATTTVTVNPNVKTIAGTISLGSWTGPITTPVIVIEIRDSSTNAVLQTNNVNLAAGGAFSFTSTLPNGTYKLRVKGQTRFLSKVQTGVVFSNTGISGLSFSLLNGDASGDNTVGPADLLKIRAAYGTTPSSPTWDPNADLNGDGTVGPADLLVVRSTYGQSGQN